MHSAADYDDRENTSKIYTLPLSKIALSRGCGAHMATLRNACSNVELLNWSQATLKLRRPPGFANAPTGTEVCCGAA